MTVLPLIIAPDERLNTVSEPIAEITADIKQLAADMFDTMYDAQGIGLAAVQVGVLKRLLVVDVDWKSVDEKGVQHVLINPEIVSNEEELTTYKEGCLSFPEQFSDVKRPKSITVRYLDLEGNTQEQTMDGLLATCIQHEIDHLNGIVFVDHISKLKRDMIHRKLTKMKKQGFFEPHVHDEHCSH